MTHTLLIGSQRDSERLRTELHGLGIAMQSHSAHAYWILIDQADSFSGRFSGRFSGKKWRPFAYASQALPNATALNESSIANIARACAARIAEALPEGTDSWRFDVFGAEGRSGDPHTQRSALVKSAIIKELSRTQRTLLKRQWRTDMLAGTLTGTLTEPRQAVPAWRVQIAVADEGESWISIYRQGTTPNEAGLLSNCSGGYHNPVEDSGPPSRAFQKLVEGQEHLGLRIRPREICVDLGACPGGWTYIAVQQGALVTAVDRSPLANSLMTHKSVRFHQGDAFKFFPAAPPVDWLICDVIAYPERTRDLLRDWIENHRCRNFFVTMKFKGEPSYQTMEETIQALLPCCQTLSVRHLQSNKNEVMFAGTLEETSANT